MKHRFLWLLAALVALVNIALWGAVKAGRLTAELLGDLTDTFPTITSIVAVVFLARAVAPMKGWDRTKIAWTVLLAGFALCAGGESIWQFNGLVLGLDMDSIFPSVCDLFWIPGNTLIAAGVIILLVNYLRSGLGTGKPAFYWALAIGAVAGSALALKYLILPIFADSEMTALTKAAYAFYPAVDLVSVVPAIILAYLTSLMGQGAMSRPWRYMIICFLLRSLFDIAYCYLTWIEAYQSGSLFDIAWNLSYVFAALGAASQRDLLAAVDKELTHG